MRSPREPRGRSGLTLGRRAGLIFMFLAVLLIVETSVVIYELEQVTLDVKKFTEETREARISHNLRSEIKELLYPLPPGPGRTDRMKARLIEARASLDQLGRGPRGEDPSRAEHQLVEEDIVASLRDALRQFEMLQIQGVPAPEEETRALHERIGDLAARMHEETDAEARLASDDLEARVNGIVRILILTGVVTTTILVFLFWLVHRVVVRPVRVVRQGAQSFGSGNLETRIGIASNDEIGDLAREFNRMADSLTRTHRHLEETVRERTREFIQAARLADLGAFAAGIAHEVNTPLASIASCAEGLERRLASGQVDTDEGIEYLRTIAREAYRAHEITDRLLDFARRDPGPLDSLRIDGPAREVARLMKHQLDARGIKLDLVIDPGLRPVEANGSEMGQVILNLLRNALDASPDGGTIRLSCRNEGESVVMEIRDEGPGIATGDLGRIFDPFFTTKAPGTGTGLGLSLVFRIVESYRGRIEAGNAPGGGALFRVSLPAARVAQPEEA